MSRALKALINEKALLHNFEQIKKMLPKQKILSMIKADAYGHGIVRVAKALLDSDGFGVACIEEAIQLRDAGIKNKILLCEGFFNENELESIHKNNFSVVIHNLEQVNILQNTDKPLPESIWLKIDTGMHRLGLPIEDACKTIQALTNKNISIQILMTHFSSANELNNKKTESQIEKFEYIAKQCPDIPVSLSNSAGILGWPSAHGDWIRPGIMLYGVSPYEDTTGVDHGLKPAMTLETNIIAIHNLQPGSQIGYGGIFTCDKPMRVGTIAVGYGDGYPWCTPEGTPVLVNGVETRIVGRVSMDMATIDLTDLPEAAINDKVVLWGESLPVEKVAKYIGTIPYELVTGLSNRVPVISQ